VEDLAWSPTEAGVFASCGCDSQVKIWDVRAKAAAQLSEEVHPGVDVNVIAWSRLVTYLLVSGGDDGVFKIWDLRNFKACVVSPLLFFCAGSQRPSHSHSHNPLTMPYFRATLIASRLL
jgi:ribosome assembly protein RRB1